MRLKIFERTSLADHARQLTFGSFAPELKLEGLVTGADNVRYDVFLSPKVLDVARAQITFLIEKYGRVEDVFRGEGLSGAGSAVPTWREKASNSARPTEQGEKSAEFKKLLADLQLNALNTAKAQSNLSVDLLARLAVLKLLRTEISAQYVNTVERLRTRVKSHENARASARLVEWRDRLLNLQVQKKIVLRKVGQDIFATLREVEKESVARMRRSLFGEEKATAYELLLNRLVFTEDGHDDYLNAEQYVMVGNYERDPDRFQVIEDIARDFFLNLEVGKDEPDPEEYIDGLLSVPENALELFANGAPDSTAKGKSQKALLTAWTTGLEQTGMLAQAIAAYEVVPLLPEYSPLIDPQQLKNALISRTERKRVETLLDEHGKTSSEKLALAIKRFGAIGGAEKAKVAARFMGDFMRYHRDLRRLESVNVAIETVNVVTNDKLRELSAINNTLYEFLLPEEEKRGEDKVLNHIIVKADIRDSTTLTRRLIEKALNPASYFSLNFYEPINKLLPKYGATKVFIEGDAVILAMFERESESGFGVARTCTLAREMIEIVRAYNEKSLAASLPPLELGIGVSYQDSAPMYLLDGNTRIMISDALNESDRLSSCAKGARRFVGQSKTPFSVFAFQTVDDCETGGMPDEFLLRYNIGGIHISPRAFAKLRSEISLREQEVNVPLLWGPQTVRLYSGLVPVVAGAFREIVIREGVIPLIDPATFAVKAWTNRKYYEVCTGEEIARLLARRSFAS